MLQEMLGRMTVVCNALVLVCASNTTPALAVIKVQWAVDTLELQGRGGILQTEQLTLKREENKSVPNMKRAL